MIIDFRLRSIHAWNRCFLVFFSIRVCFLFSCSFVVLVSDQLVFSLISLLLSLFPSLPPSRLARFPLCSVPSSECAFPSTRLFYLSATVFCQYHQRHILRTVITYTLSVRHRKNSNKSQRRKHLTIVDRHCCFFHPQAQLTLKNWPSIDFFLYSYLFLTASKQLKQFFSPFSAVIVYSVWCDMWRRISNRQHRYYNK